MNFKSWNLAIRCHSFPTCEFWHYLRHSKLRFSCMFQYRSHKSTFQICLVLCLVPSLTGQKGPQVPGKLLLWLKAIVAQPANRSENDVHTHMPHAHVFTPCIVTNISRSVLDSFPYRSAHCFCRNAEPQLATLVTLENLGRWPSRMTAMLVRTLQRSRPPMGEAGAVSSSTFWTSRHKRAPAQQVTHKTPRLFTLPS